MVDEMVRPTTCHASPMLLIRMTTPSRSMRSMPSPASCARGYVAAGDGPLSVTVDPSGKFAYVANSSDGTISAYTINAVTGTLTPVAGSPFLAGNGSYSVSVDPSGKFAYVTNFNDDNVSAYTIDATTGVLTAVVGSPFLAGNGSYSITTTGTFE